MPKYLVKYSYTQEGVQGLMKEGGTARRDSISAAIAALGGTLETFLYAFGEDDLYLILDLPDQTAMATIALTIGASGAGVISTTVLLTPEEIDQAVQQSFNYRPPGA